MTTIPSEESIDALDRDDLEDLYSLLDGIKESGEVNMMWAAPDLSSMANELEVGEILGVSEARRILEAWMKDYR